MDSMEKPQQSFPLKDFILAEKDQNGLYRPQNYCNTSPEKGPFFSRNVVFQPSFLRVYVYVSFRGSTEYN